MSGRLGRIPYPLVDPRGELDTNPLSKYANQLSPLGQVTQNLQPPVRPAPVVPVPPHPLAIAPAQHAIPSGAIPSPAAMPSSAMMPSRAEMPPGPMPLGTPGSAMLGGMTPGMAPGPSPAHAAVADALLAQHEAAMPPGAETDPHGLTQYSIAPGGGLRRPGGLMARRAAALRGQVPEYGSDLLGQEPMAPEDAQGAIPPPEDTSKLPENVPGMSQSDKRISTRIPSEPEQRKTGINAHETAGLSVDYANMKRAPDALAKNAGLIKEHYPGLQHLNTDDPAKITEAFIQHAKDNLKWIYNKMNDEKGPIGPGIVERAKRWYSGANKIAHDLAKEFNVQPYQAAAVLAALSPQKDWYQNVHLARKVFEAHQLGNNWTMTPEMQAYSDKYLHSLENPPKKKGVEVEPTNPEQIAKLRALQQKFRTTPMSKLTDPHERAVFARWYDEAHNPRSYKMVTPEGEMAGDSMIPAKYTKKGALKEAARPRNVSWGSFNEIAKATAALQNATLPEVSRLMGGNHKVRNFFNNIIAPLHGHDVTIDTHAIAAALLRPLGGSAMAVGHGLGTSAGKGVPGAANSATIGNRGMYGLYAEAYRRAAKDLGISPRELQSVTWEGIRGLFSPEQKRDANFVKHVDSVWANRNMTRDEKREAIATHAGGFKLPSWAGGVDHGDED